MTDTQAPPKRFGILLFPEFQALDAFGVLDALNTLSCRHILSLSVIAATLDPVSTKIRTPPNPLVNSDFSQSVVPTHDFDTAPPLDVLIIPGGAGAKRDDIAPIFDFVKRTYPSLQYLFAVCTGSWIAARAGVLDGKRATSNKASWAGVKALGTNVDWIAHARWVVDGNVWTSSGVSAGIDAVLAFIEHTYGPEEADFITNEMELERQRDPSWDPFAVLYGL